MISKLQSAYQFFRKDKDSFFKVVGLCEDWAGLVCGKSVPKVARNFFDYVGQAGDLFHWPDLFKRLEKWGQLGDSKKVPFALCKTVFLTATGVQIATESFFGMKRKTLPRIQWAGDAARVILDVRGLKRLWDSKEHFDKSLFAQKGLSVVFSVIKLFEFGSKRSVVPALASVALSTSCFVTKLWKKNEKAE